MPSLGPTDAGTKVTEAEPAVTRDAAPREPVGCQQSLASRVLGLQRTAGNRAVGRLLAGNRQLQRLVKTADQLDAEIDAAIKANDWGKVALVLNGFNDEDIKARVTSDSRLSGKRRELMAGAVKSMILWPDPHRVSDALNAADSEAARLGLIDYIKDAAARRDWRGAVIALNGLSDDDIDDLLNNELPRGSTMNLWEAANTCMKGWEGHVVARFRRIEPPFRNPGVKAAYMADRLHGTVEQLRALWILDPARTGVWPKLTWDAVAASAASRVYHPERIDQDVLGLCGPAAALHADAEQHATKFARLVVEVFSEGKADREKVNEHLRGNAPPPTMDPCDWMVLSAMQDVLNTWYDYYGEDPGTGKEDKRAGLFYGRVERALERFDGCVETAVWTQKGAAFAVKHLLDRYRTESIVVMHVDSKVLQGLPSQDKGDHYIRILSPVYHKGDTTYFDAFTWGSTNTHTYSFKNEDFAKLWHAYIVGATRKGILSEAKAKMP
jgi:hypothetical protein